MHYIITIIISNSLQSTGKSPLKASLISVIRLVVVVLRPFLAKASRAQRRVSIEAASAAMIVGL